MFGLTLLAGLTFTTLLLMVRSRGKQRGDDTQLLTALIIFFAGVSFQSGFWMIYLISILPELIFPPDKYFVLAEGTFAVTIANLIRVVFNTNKERLYH